MYSQNQYTPLYAASAKGFNEVVQSLVTANADVNCVCKVSCYAYTSYSYIAVYCKSFKVEKFHGST